MRLEELLKILEKYKIEELEGVKIEGDLEIEVEGSPIHLKGLARELGMAAYHLARAAKLLGYPVEIYEEKIEEKEVKPEFVPYEIKFPGRIEEVTLGATSRDGGTRSYTITVGGESDLPFFNYKNMPAFTIDVFDKPISLPKAVREHYEDVMEDPVDWAKKALDFGADMVTLHLISTDPLLDDTPINEAVKVVEDLLQGVKCPIAVGGSGNKEKDPKLFEKVAEVSENERILLSSATLDMDWERIANAAKRYNHVVLAWTQLDINSQRTLNRYLLRKAGLPRKSLMMDPTTAPLGYGLDYAFSNVEKIRISALKGEDELAFPISSGTTNAWGAREAWMKESPTGEDWGARELRGPLWEIVTGVTLALAGVDLFMMIHPVSVAVVKELIKMLCGKIEGDFVDWVMT